MERFIAARKPTGQIVRRWVNNLSFAWLNGFIVRLLAPLGLVGLAQWTAAQHLGLFHWIVPSYLVLEIVVCVLVLDLVIYWQHRLFHVWEPLWRIHAVHHADPDLDASTAGRFHFIEIIISFFIKALCVVLLGCPAAAIILFETLLAAFAIFNHGNIRLTQSLERSLRWVTITPSLHLIHHSDFKAETNSNYGVLFIWWDKLFNSFHPHPVNPSGEIQIGLQLQAPTERINLASLLLFPLSYRGAKNQAE